MIRAKKVLAAIITAAVLFSSVPTNIIARADNYIEVTSSKSVSTDNAKFTLNGDTLTIKIGTNVLDLQACSEEILKVNYKPNGKESEDTLTLDPDRVWNTGNIISYDLESDPVVLKTKKMTVKISKTDFSVSVYDASNGLLVKQSTLPPNNTLTLSHNSNQNFYGISAEGNTMRADTTLRKGTTNVSAGSQGHAGAPFAWTTSGYGILVDSDGGNIDIQDTSFSYNSISKDDTEYYVLVGNPTEVLEAQAKVSGTSPMFPKWATGFTNTQWGWEEGSTAEDQLKKVIDTYRSKQIPIDNFCLDFDWKLWGTGDDYGEFIWNHHNFPSAASGELKKYMDSKGVKLTGIVKPRLFTGTAEANDMEQNGWWYSGTGVITDYCAKKPVKQVDFSKEGLREWWWQQSQGAFDLGLVGFWNDEVDIDNGFKNFDGLNMQRAIYDGQSKYTSSQRVWSINRNFYLGAQRYAYGLWSGDIRTGFESMKLHKDKLIASVNLGQAKWGMDTGGFIGTPDSENYARWVQFSAFTPIFRVHGQDITEGNNKVRYPWAYGATAEAACKSVMQLRYKLIPYIYKYENQAYESGLGLIKSLMMEYPNDPNTAEYTDAWMFGDYLLVSPVLEKGQTTKSIYLPKGTWIDYFSGKVYNGGQTITINVDSKNWSDVPLFIKQGAIIPSQDYINYVGEKKIDTIYVDAFPGVKETTFDYYDDDGNSTSYKEGNYFKQEFVLSRNEDWTGAKFTTSKKEGSYNADVKYYIVKMHVDNNGTPTVNGDTVTKYNSLEALKSASGEGYAIGTDVYGKVAYVKIAAGKNKEVEVPCEFEESEEQTVNIFGRSTDTTGKLQYSLDGGSTWSTAKSMPTANDIVGYLEGSVTYKLRSSIPVRVRFSDKDGYKPSKSGVELPESDSEIFTINSDGTITVGKPVLQSTNVYFETEESCDSLIFQYKTESGDWSNKITLEPYLGTAGHFYASFSYPVDIDSTLVRYSNDGGDTWLPSSAGQAVGSGDYKNSSNGKLVTGKPSWKNKVVVYYNCKNGYSAPYIHWRATGGTWTSAPGILMTKSEYEGYAKAILDIDTATSAEVCFNNGSGSWDNNGGSNYTLSAGILTFDKGKITSGAPNVGKILTVLSNIQGGNFTSEQSITLSPSIEGATIYYTLDGSTPTTSSTEYTKAIKIDSTTTIKAIAVYKNEKSSVFTQTYNFVDPTEDCMIYFKKPSDWGTSIKAYIYNEDNGSLRRVAAWPGVAMNSIGDGIYSYTLQNWEGNAYVIFTDGSKQTPGSREKGYEIEAGQSKILEDGNWKDYIIQKDPTVSCSDDSCDFTDAFKVTLNASDCTKSTYQINNGEKIEFTNGTKITIGENAKNGDVIKLKLSGTNGDKTVNETYVYTCTKIVDTPSKVFFRRPNGWKKTIKAYFYSSNSSSAKKVITMTSKVTNVYTCTLEDFEGDAYVVFTDGIKKLPESGKKYYLPSGSTKLYYYGLWADYEVKEPIVSTSKESCEFEDSLTLSLTAENCIGSSYFINDNAAKVYKNGDKITIGKDAKAGDKITVKVVGNNGEKSVNKTYTYTKKGTVSNESKIYFRKPNGWSNNIKVCIFSKKDHTLIKKVKMTSKVTRVYTYTLKNATEDVYVIFTDGTNKLKATSTKGFYLPAGSTRLYNKGKWADYEVKEPVVKTSKASCSFSSSLTLTLTAENCISASYIINGKAATVYANGTKITIGKNLSSGQKVTVKVVGNNGDKTVSKTYTYTKK